MSSICKFCRASLPSFRELKFHVELEHPEAYLKIANWLGKTVQPKIESFEKLAAEGMTGAKETVNDPRRRPIV